MGLVVAYPLPHPPPTPTILSFPFTSLQPYLYL
jgi:hypothetical protein